MKRMSKREIEFRFDLMDEARVRIERFERGHAITKLEGIECRLGLLRSERRDLLATGVLLASVTSYPSRVGDGWLPRGTVEVKDDLVGFFNHRSGRQPVCLHSTGLDFDTNTRKYEQFARRHPVGSLVEAEVMAVLRNKVTLLFEGEIFSKMSISDYVDRWPSRRRNDLESFYWPARIEVIVRRIDPRRHIVAVSMHGYPKDDKYCAAAAGYRPSYDASKGMFKRLPWERATQES